MELNDLRSIVTLAGLVLFLALAVWTWMPRRRAAHDMAAQLPFLGEANEHDNGATQ